MAMQLKSSEGQCAIAEAELLNEALSATFESFLNEVEKAGNDCKCLASQLISPFAHLFDWLILLDQ